MCSIIEVQCHDQQRRLTSAIIYSSLGTDRISPLLPKPLRDCPKSDLPGIVANNCKRNHKFFKISYLLFVIMDILLIICILHLEISFLLFVILYSLLMICNLHLHISYLLQMILYLLLMICNLQVSFPPNPSVAQRRGALLRTSTSM